eukprot:7388490-Prymnesium_polylepis.1
MRPLARALAARGDLARLPGRVRERGGAGRADENEYIETKFVGRAGSNGISTRLAEDCAELVERRLESSLLLRRQAGGQGLAAHID